MEANVFDETPVLVERIKARKWLRREINRLQRRLRDHPAVEGARLTSLLDEHPVHLDLWTQSHSDCTSDWVANVVERLSESDGLQVRLEQPTRDGVITPRQFKVIVWYSEEIVSSAMSELDEKPRRSWRFVDADEEPLSA